MDKTASKLAGMNRRRFLSLTSLAPLASLVRLPSVDPKSYLAAFCASEYEYREFLKAPFTMAGYHVASDARIMLRVVDSAALPPDPATGVPDIGKIDWMRNYVPGDPFRILPFPDLPRWVPCPECLRVGPAPEDAELYCWSCENKGEEPFWSGRLDGVREEFRYLKLLNLEKILSLPGPVSFALPVMDPISLDPPLRFTWAHGDGFLMPMAVSVGEKTCQMTLRTVPA